MLKYLCGLLVTAFAAVAQTNTYSVQLDEFGLLSGATAADTIYLYHPTVPNAQFPALASAISVIVYECEALTNASFPALKAHIGQNSYQINVYENHVLRTLDLSALVSSAGSISIIYNESLTNIMLDKLVFVHRWMTFYDNDALATLNLPELVSVATFPWQGLSARGCANLANVSLPKYLPTNGRLQTFDGCALTQASVDHILARCVAAPGYVSGTVDVSLGTSSAPSAAGLTNVAILQARGVTVNHN